MPSQIEFVGRRQEIAELSNAWRQKKPVFIYGKSGMGKTELVAHASTVNRFSFSRGDFAFADQHSEADTCSVLKDVFDDSFPEDFDTLDNLLRWLRTFDLKLNKSKICFFDELGYLEECFDANSQLRCRLVDFLIEAIAVCKNIKFAFAAISSDFSSEANKIVALCHALHLKGMSEDEVVEVFARRSLKITKEALLLIKQRTDNSPRHIQRIAIGSAVAGLELISKKDVEQYLLSVPRQ